MIRAEFRLICGSNSDADRFIARFDLPDVPATGELINIDGEPYVVVERAWSVSTRDCGAVLTQSPTMYAYFRVTRLQSRQGG